MLQALNSETAARRLLAAVEGGNLARIETELGRSRPAPPESPAGTAERWELLEAVSADMRLALRRLQLHATAGLAGREVHARLLRHLAGCCPAI